MRRLELCCLASFLALVPACSSMHATPESGSGKTAASDDGAKAKSKDDADDEKDSNEDKAKKKERDVADARIQLSITQKDCEAAERKQKDEVEEAEYGMGKAREALEHFQKVTRKLEEEKAQLGVDQAKNRVEEQKQNLEELMSLYKAEDFAAVTKEKVIGRGQKQFEFANRNLAQEEVELATTRDVELPRKEKDLELALHKAENKLREEKFEQAKLAQENELKLRKAERAVDDGQQELDKLKSKAAKNAKDAKVAKP